MSLLYNQTIKGTSVVKDDSGLEILHATEPHALVMAAGYLKYKQAKDANEGIYFRGQRMIYGTLMPTLYRDVSTDPTQKKRNGAINKIVKEFQKKAPIFTTFGDYAHEAILQHYGLSTTWIDLVDNVWVALWFACHKLNAIGDQNEFMHFQLRIPSNKEKYAYILLVGADIKNRDRTRPGYFSGEATELIDLRMAAPSIFLRPHAQHGLLFRKVGKDGIERALDYADQIRGIIRVDLQDAVTWLGSGKMLSTNSLFPPPYYDNGYQILLTCGAIGLSTTGRISHIGA